MCKWLTTPAQEKLKPHSFILMFKTEFAEEHSNRRIRQKSVYSLFVTYSRDVYGMVFVIFNLRVVKLTGGCSLYTWQSPMSYLIVEQQSLLYRLYPLPHTHVQQLMPSQFQLPAKLPVAILTNPRLQIENDQFQVLYWSKQFLRFYIDVSAS